MVDFQGSFWVSNFLGCEVCLKSLFRDVQRYWFIGLVRSSDLQDFLGSGFGKDDTLGSECERERERERTNI